MKRLLTALAVICCFLACERVPEEIPVASVSLSQPMAEMVVGEFISLSATVLPFNASDKTVTWASSNQSVATVTVGKVTAIGEGSATITASSGGKSATCAITVKKKVIAVTSVELNKTELALVEGDSDILEATVKPDDASDKTVTWTTSNATIATVDNGKVTAEKEGTATVTAKAGEKTATCVIVVAKKVIPVESIELNKTTLTLIKGTTESLVATVKPDNATYEVTWSSSNEAVAAVDQDGKVTAVGGGEVAVTAQAGEKKATCSVMVTVPVESVSLDKTTLELWENESVTIIATVLPDDATDKTVTWTSSDDAIATVLNGEVTAVKEGIATITAKAGEESASCSVTVNALHLEAVDLGLSVKWASFNLGAYAPEEYGNYYAWGEIETKSVFSWSRYIWCQGSSSSITKYNEDDCKTILDPEDDAAQVRLGGKWRMPTYDEWVELKARCNWTWTTQNGIFGYRVAGNGNSIFLPAAGEQVDSNYREVGYMGFYWSCSLRKIEAYTAWLLFFNSDKVSETFYGRQNGFSIRPVLGDLIRVSHVEVSPSSIQLKEGETVTLTATVYPSDAAIKSRTWKSSDSRIASVDELGKVTAKTEGSVTITAITGDGGYTSSCTVTVIRNSTSAISIGRSFRPVTE